MSNCLLRIFLNDLENTIDLFKMKKVNADEKRKP